MNIRPFDYTTADYVRYVALRNSVSSDQPASVAYERRTDSELPAGQMRERLLVEGEDGRALAAADYGHMAWAYHPRKFSFMIVVRADARRQGLGSRLFESIVQALSTQDAQSLQSETREDWADGVRFLEKRGFRQVMRQQQSELDPAGFDPASFQQTVEAAAASGVAIKTLAEVLAEDGDALRKLYDLANEVMLDLPWYEEMTAQPFEAWALSYEDNPDLLPEGYFVALSQLWGSQATDTLLYTGFTAVKRPYRQRGLATAMKVRAVQYAQRVLAADGRAPRIVTSNEENNPMLQINLRLGFQERPAWLIYSREEEGQQQTAD